MKGVAQLARFEAKQGAVEPDGATSHPWPELPQEALHGLAADYVSMIEPHTEADPVGILIQFLVMFGNLIGRGPHFKVEADEHHLNQFTVLVGETGKGRKGVSSNQAKRLFQAIDRGWCEDQIKDGLSSGEGLIWAVRDPVEKAEPVRDNGKSTGEYETVVVDSGVVDKRLLLLESEFASVLRVLKREGNTLSATVRNAWDGRDLRTLTKNSPASASGAHISIIGHITRDELLRYLDSTEAGNGFGNRFLWCCVKRSKVLPEGGAAHALDFGPLTRKLEASVAFARQLQEIRRDDEAKELWATVYPSLSEGKPGLLGSMIGRSEAHTMRLACLYALLDQSAPVRPAHLLAALGLWDYCEASARWIFEDALGDPVADEILRGLRNSPEGLTKTEIRDLFGRHRSKAVARALALLLEQGFATFEKEATDGRPIERWRATTVGPDAKSDGKHLLSLKSLMSHSGEEGGEQRTPAGISCDKSDKSDISPQEGSGGASVEKECDKSDISDKRGSTGSGREVP